MPKTQFFQKVFINAPTLKIPILFFFHLKMAINSALILLINNTILRHKLRLSESGFSELKDEKDFPTNHIKE